MDILGIQQNINSLNYTSTLVEDGLEGPFTKKAMSLFEEIFKKPCNVITTAKSLKTKSDSILKVPYFTQRISYQYSSKMCNLACTLMMSRYYGYMQHDIISLDKYVDSNTEIQQLALSNNLFNYSKSGTLEQVSLILSHLLTTFIGRKFKTQYITLAKIKELLANKHPMILATKLSGYVSKNSNAGHYVVLTGWFDDLFVINDPWGLYAQYSSPDNTTKGENVIIPKEILFGEFGVKTAYDEVKKTEINKGRYRVIAIEE